MKIIMKTNIDLTKDFTMADIISKDFVFYVRDYIKELAEDQKIAKRDRKDEKHPCPEKRKYNPYEAFNRVIEQRGKLSVLYEVYYFMKKNKDYDWSKIKLVHYKNYWGKEYIKSSVPIDWTNGCRVLGNDGICFEYLFEIIKKYVEDGRK